MESLFFRFEIELEHYFVFKFEAYTTIIYPMILKFEGNTAIFTLEIVVKLFKHNAAT